MLLCWPRCALAKSGMGKTSVSSPCQHRLSGQKVNGHHLHAREWGNWILAQVVSGSFLISRASQSGRPLAGAKRGPERMAHG